MVDTLDTEIDLFANMKVNTEQLEQLEDGWRQRLEAVNAEWKQKVK